MDGGRQAIRLQSCLATAAGNPMTLFSRKPLQCASGGWRRALLSLALPLAGCSAMVHENHHFAAYRDNVDGVREPAQFYRVTVDGSTWFSNTRYLTGYFDERAVSLFFNEIKAPANQKLFDDAMVLPGAAPGTKLTPLAPSPENGAFVMIMSTNADAVASTIGSFAESQVVADAITRMVSRDRVVAKGQSDARLTVQKAEATALVSQLDAQTKAAREANTGTQAAASYQRALTTLARSLGYTGADFDKLDDARNWFALEASRTAGTP
jgi:hypothetical protein